jgi:hypothetical protein
MGVTGKIVFLNGLWVLMGKPRLLAGAFLFTVSIIAGWVELVRQFPGQKKSFVLFWLWGFPRFWGVDRFWVGLEGQATARAISGRFGFAFTPAFGRVVAASRLALMARLKPCP